MKFNETGRGTLIVRFDGMINFNTGNTVHLEIKAEPANGFSESNGNPINEF